MATVRHRPVAFLPTTAPTVPGMPPPISNDVPIAVIDATDPSTLSTTRYPAAVTPSGPPSLPPLQNSPPRINANNSELSAYPTGLPPPPLVPPIETNNSAIAFFPSVVPSLSPATVMSLPT
eukprot:CAMPEP_0170118106 /NCGR_PEP_ID=MMETSP0020_2-20130122/13480_1 /TAXON_ID=98059 /ORGANISM="Dinobryon sp., Strain UTEXLB2267" /LENGTH=120 /DNA_ID=CAMNT_0010346977 /DNA_START=162 /DNA_END=521 /DNA_ORIENTATION=-